ARHRHQDAVARFEHLVRVDRPAHLLVAVVHEVVAAERRVVTANVDDRRPLAHPALHAGPPQRSEPPEITGRISTEASSASFTSWVTSSSPTITSTVSGLSSKRRSSACTVSGPS